MIEIITVWVFYGNTTENLFDVRFRLMTSDVKNLMRQACISREIDTNAEKGVGFPSVRLFVCKPTFFTTDSLFLHQTDKH